MLHKNTTLKANPSGLCLIAQYDLPADTCIVSCPFSLAITQELSKKALLDVTGIAFTEWSERQSISSYILFHWIAKELSLTANSLIHYTYLDALPEPAKLRTPLHFTPSELESFRGSNIYGATIDREEMWKNEWRLCYSDIAQFKQAWADAFTWDRYLTAATYLSSRAFPSTLLSVTPSLQPDPSSYPVLLPGVDSLNHARGQPVSWVVSSSATDPSEHYISLVVHTPVAAGQEIFNNYGAKPNSELILGYGFSLPQNPDDTIILRISGSDKRWEVGRGARGVEGVWEEIVELVGGGEDDEAYEIELEAAGALRDMVQALMKKLPSNPGPDVEIRPDVREMFEHYIEGQRDVLNSVMDFAHQRECLAIEKAREQGIELVLDES